MNNDSEPPRAITKLTDVGPYRLVLVACFLSLLATALMTWSLFDPTPLPVMVAMSIGQVIGTLGLTFYVAAVVAYQWRRRRVKAEPNSAGTGA